MPRLLPVAVLAAILPLGGPGVYAQPPDENPYAVAGEAGSGGPPCCDPAPAAGDALPCAGSGAASCPVPAVPTDASLGVARVGDLVPAAGATVRYRSPTLPSLFRPPIVIRT